jgi:predicted transcriptional regulator
MSHNDPSKPPQTSGQNEAPPRLFSLGSLEGEVLAVVCEHSGSSVDDVRSRLSRSFAYTTVMTTLDRLYKKGLLDRRKDGRRFVYAQKSFRAGENAAANAAGPRWPVLALSAFASHLLDAVSTYDEDLLQELERSIAQRRRQFLQKEKP